MRWFRVILILLALPALLPEDISAHPAQFTTLQVTVETDGRFQASLNIDILAYALGETSLDATNEQMQALLDGPRAILGQKLADAGERFRREVVVRTDCGDVTPSSWSLPGLPEAEAVLARKIRPPILMPGEIDFSGTLPAGAHTLSIRLPYVLGDTMQVFELPNGESAACPVVAGGYSEKVHLILTPPAAPPKVSIPPIQRHSDYVGSISKALGCALVVIGIFFIASRLKPRFRAR